MTKGAWTAQAVADHLGGGGGYAGLCVGARRARLCLYGVALAFAAFAAFLAFAPSLPAPSPLSSPVAPWFDGFLASASPYRAQVSGFFSSLFPANSSYSGTPPGEGVAARRSEPSCCGLAAAGTNGSSAVRPGEQRSGSGGRVPSSDVGGARGGNSGAPGNATTAVQSHAPPSGHVGGGAPSSDAGGVRGGNSRSGNATTAAQSHASPNDHVGGGAAANNSAGIAGQAEAGAGVTIGSSSQDGTVAKGGAHGSYAQNGTMAKGGAPVRFNGSETSAGSGEATTSNGTAASLINQTGSAVAGVIHGNGAASHRRGPPGSNQSVQKSPTANNQDHSGSNSTMDMHKEGTATSQGSASLAKDHTSQAATAKSSNSSSVPVVRNGQKAKESANAGGQKQDHWIEAMGRCDMFYGNWVRDDSYPLYPEGSCPHVDESFNCYLNGRPDKDYQRLRWQPSGCSIPRLNPSDMLERLRGKRLVFVGDSLNRNMWESLVCILRNSIKDKRKVFEVSGNQKFRAEGSYSFLFQDYNCSVEFFRSPFLVQEWETPARHGKNKETLRLDVIDHTSPRYKSADIIVFNTGHWWTHEKTSLGKDYYQEGNHVYSELNVDDAYRRALNTWAKWVDANVNPRRTTVFFRGYSASHFSGGQWNSGGSCDKETKPIRNEHYLVPYPQKMSILEEVLHEMKTPVVYMNITRMTDYRKEAHPSVYRRQKLSEEERKSPELYQDCSHWCLPGVPDSWNELLYAQILVKQHQMIHQ